MTTATDPKSLIKGLNPQQKEAVLKSYRQPTLVIAGAGSGKTKVLTTRVAYILSKGIDPRKLLTVTFTNKAAKEMKERIELVVGEKKAKKILVGTFHSLAVRWLHQYYAEAGLRKSWTIFDDEDTTKVLKTAMQNLGVPTDKQSINAYKSRISNLKNAMILPKDFKKTMQAHERSMYDVYRAYQDSLQRQNGVDFDDLILRTVLMLESNPDVRAKFQARYKFVMCDEYQDTNECQYRMINLIVGGKNNIFVVGDDYQSIYGWRGADVQKILNFKNDYPNTKIIKLEQNYRSTKTIVKAGNAIMKHNTMQMDKVCFSEHEEGDRIKVVQNHDDESEARFIAEEINNLTTFGNYDFKDIAILYRTNVQSRLLEDQFIRHHIPYNMVSGFSFYSRKEIKDILAWLQIAVNPDNDIACERILNLQKGIGKTTIAGIKKSQQNYDDKSMYDIVENSSPKKNTIAAAFAGMTNTVARLNALHEAGKAISDSPISDMFELVFKYTGYIQELRDSGKEEEIRRIDNLMELQKIAKGYEEEVKNPTIQDFLDQIALQSKVDNVQDDNKVQMMTLHTSKGLEYPVVFLIGMEEGLFPHSQSMDALSLEEERRLCYVGITRAQKLLYMTHANRRMDWQRNWTWQTKSRFIEELPQELREDV